MHFTKYAIALALPILAVATGPVPTTTTTGTTTTRATTTTVTVTSTATATQPASQCNTGPIQCCNSVQSASSGPASLLLGLLNIVLPDLNVPVGITCGPLSVLGIGSPQCQANPVCCENNSFNGVVAIGCVPVNLSL